MNTTTMYVYKKVLYEIFVKFDGVEEFINQKIKEICCQEKLSME